MEYPADVPLSCGDDPSKMAFRVSFDLIMGIGINLLSQEQPSVYHNLGQSLNILLQLRNLSNPLIPNIHLNIISSVIFHVLFLNELRLIGTAVQVVAALGGVVLALELLYPAGPAQAVVDLGPGVLGEGGGWEVGEFGEKGQGLFSGRIELWDS